MEQLIKNPLLQRFHSIVSLWLRNATGFEPGKQSWQIIIEPL